MTALAALLSSRSSAGSDTDAAPPAPTGPIIGNRCRRIHEWPGCPYYDKVSTANRVEFASAAAAEQAGHRAARNCR